jgi:D-alanyl-D-alanine carboxypeptidase (penicillin-binding protein 5/6)
MDQAELKSRARKRAAKQKLETVVCWLIIIFVVMTLVFMTVLLALSLGEGNSNEPPKPQETTTKAPAPDDGGNGDPQPTKPIFSAGVLPTPPTASAETVALGDEISSQYAILIDAETGAILAGKDFDVKFSPASMTKVMTLIVALENLTAEDLDRKLAFTEEIHEYVTSGNYKGTSSSLPVTSGGETCIGDTYTIRDLLYGIGVASAADCTYMIVKEVAGTEEAFVQMMNQKAAAMGLTNTHFDNAVGFDSETNYTTAMEMAMIMQYAMQNDLLADVLSQKANYRITAHYIKDGLDTTYNVTLKCSWQSRFEKYSAFNPTTTTVEMTKTGYTDQSFITATAKQKGGSDRYILVLGNKTSSATTITEKFKQTMMDMEYLLNNHAK